MAGIWLPPRRLATQPQTVARVDWNNPSLEGVSASIVQVGGLSGFAVNRGKLIASPVIGGTVVTDGTNAGLALKFDGTSTYLDYGTANIPTVEFTVMWGGIFDANDSPRGIFDCTNNGVSGWNIYQGGGDTMYFNNSSYPAGNPSTGWTVGQFFHGALRNKGGVAADWWRGGTKVASYSGVSPAAPTLPFWVGKLKVGGLPFMKARFSYFYLFDKFLDDAAIISLQGNPYQIFNSQRVIWSATAATGSVGTASGVGAASGVGISINAQAGTSAGIGAASGVGASINAQSGSSSGTSTVSGVGASDFAGVGSSSGTGTASGVGGADIPSVGSSSGTSTVSGVGTSSTGSFGTASGTSTVNGVGSSTVDSVGSAAGVASVSGVSASDASTVASASGSATVSGVGDSIIPGSAVGTASGSSSVSGVGASIVAAVGTADGSSVVSGKGSSSGGNVEQFAGGYISREERAERVRKKRVELGIVEEEKPVTGTGQKKAEKRIIALEQERIRRNEELKRLIQLEIEREEEQIIRLLMEM